MFTLCGVFLHLGNIVKNTRLVICLLFFVETLLMFVCKYHNLVTCLFETLLVFVRKYQIWWHVCWFLLKLFWYLFANNIWWHFCSNCSNIWFVCKYFIFLWAAHSTFTLSSSSHWKVWMIMIKSRYNGNYRVFIVGNVWPTLHCMVLPLESWNDHDQSKI